MNTNDTAPPAASGKPNGSDTLFLIFIALILVAVVWLGGINFREGQHLEDAKRNGEAWAAWLTEAGTKRMEDRKSTRLNSSHVSESRMPSSA